MSEMSKGFDDSIYKRRHSSNRPQSYGGEGGIIFTKRKYEKKKRNSSSARLHNNNNNDDFKVKFRKDEKDNDVLKCIMDKQQQQKSTRAVKVKNQTTITTKNGLSETHLIGWDDVLCRPIYYNNTKKNTVPTISPCSLNHNKKEEEDDDESVKTSQSLESPTAKYSLEGHSSPEPFWSMSLSKSKNNNNNTKKRSYGRGKGKYNHRLNLSASSKATLEETRSNIRPLSIMSKRNTVSKLHEKDKTCHSSKLKINLSSDPTDESNKTQLDHRSLILTPDMYEKSVCSALDSDAKQTTNGRRTSRFSQRQNNNHPIPKIDNFETITNDNQKLDSFQPKNDMYVKIPQPSHKTPLTVARAFFEDLDKNEVLTVQKLSQDTATQNNIHDGSVKRDPIRTKRPFNLADPKLKKQYSLYCNAARDSGVTPIDLKEFVKSRENFFHTLGMFDGILEEI